MKELTRRSQQVRGMSVCVSCCLRASRRRAQQRPSYLDSAYQLVDCVITAISCPADKRVFPLSFLRSFVVASPLFCIARYHHNYFVFYRCCSSWLYPYKRNCLTLLGDFEIVKDFEKIVDNIKLFQLLLWYWVGGGGGCHVRITYKQFF